MREVIISQIIYGFVQKADFKGWSSFSANNLGLALGTTLKFYSSVEKRLRLKVKKCWGKLEGGLFALPPPPILNSVKNDLADSRSVKTIEKERYNNTISLSRHEQVCLIGLRFERYFSHHRVFVPMMGEASLET